MLLELQVQAAGLTSIFFSGLIASAFLGSVTVSTPFLNLASILSRSTLSGSAKQRSNEKAPCCSATHNQNIPAQSRIVYQGAS